MEELGPDMVVSFHQFFLSLKFSFQNKEYFEDPCYIVQSVIKSIQARLDEYGDDESQKNISALASTTTLTNTSALTNDTTHSHNPDTTTDTFEDSIANSSYDNEFYMDGVAHNVETLTNEANQAITVREVYAYIVFKVKFQSIRSFANQLEDVMEKSQQPHSLDLRWACTPTKKFKQKSLDRSPFLSIVV